MGAFWTGVVPCQKGTTKVRTLRRSVQMGAILSPPSQSRRMAQVVETDRQNSIQIKLVVSTWGVVK